MIQRKLGPVRRCAAGFLITVALAVLLLAAAAYLPQENIQHNVSNSIFVFLTEDNYPLEMDYEQSSQMDNFTDMLILHASMYMDNDIEDSVLANPMYEGPQTVLPYEDLEYLLWERGNDTDPLPEPTFFYPRYWMGFRGPMRLLLTQLDFMQIRRLLANVFFVLMAAAACVTARFAGYGAAFCFMTSIALVKPNLISYSPQFACCFLIAMAGMLLAPFIHRYRRFEALFFMELGMITMYFDFYTTPVIVLGYPLVLLLMMAAREGERISASRVGKAAGVWLAGYGGMWLSKLLLTTLFTPINGFENGFSSMAGRIGVTKTKGFEKYYDLGLAVDGLLESIFPTRVDLLLTIALVALLAAAAFVLVRLRKSEICRPVGHAPLLAVSLLPILWFLCTIQPIAIHSWFQYRSIALTYFALGAYACSVLRFKTPEKNQRI